ncbi:UNVERIFIED_CONTAM: putative phospholipid-transporting ATPase 5 [Sesamum radiatum]|uniref:Phospholipid-transporting ATPase n=1 Tax=Sesamum radiatum TaxID=300843 RepID=A0AAW2T1Y0_SESRA
MSGPTGRRKQKLKWSKLYTFSCLRPTTDESAPTESSWAAGIFRVVFCNESQLHKSKPHKYPNNYVSTTKYNLITFLPRALFEQFRRVANLYFLLAAVLSVTPLAAFNPVSVIAPLVFVVGLSMLKEAIEDWHRFLQDRNVNSRRVKVHVGNGLFVQKSWKSLGGRHCQTVGSALYTKSGNSKMWYLRLHDDTDNLFDPEDPMSSGFLQFVRALVLYGYLIPISLYVSIELVKVLQAMLINKDLAIKCSIEGISYGGEVTEVDLAASRRMNIDVERYRYSLDGSDSTGRSIEMFDLSTADGSTEKDVLGFHQGSEDTKTGNSRISSSQKETTVKGFNFRDNRLMDKMWIYRSNVSDMIMFRVMALCHTGIPVEENRGNKLTYEAESPEEVAFLIAAQEFGFKFCQRTQSTMVLQELDPSGLEVKREYKLLNLLEFNSSRKRMSVIISNEDGEIFLLCKGADELADNGRTYQQATVMHLSMYAEDGLRTMVFAYKKIGLPEYENWSSVFKKAKATIGPEREELLENASEMIEKELLLLGAVAVEDKLQKGVPECIDKLAQAGLKIWLLTGDKKETAVNIGFACSLLRHDMKQLHLCLRKESPSNQQIKDVKEEILCQLQSYNQLITEEDREGDPFALVVDGKALEVSLSYDVRNHFLSVAMRCDVVICCRVSPKQKALITRTVKEHSGKTVLAIGDGANDVGMIQEADIGVGISGMEGMQAVMASDFSLPQFRFLERLLIVHGHWCYKRISKMILYFVYKNIAFGLTLFYYNIFTGFSGQDLYDDWYMVMFNVLLTSLPVISLGVLEQDVSSDVCLKFPALYQEGQRTFASAGSESSVGFLMESWLP